MAEPTKQAVDVPGEEDPTERFTRQRSARQSMVSEDYVEVIAELIDTTGEARAVDLAKRFGVSHATAVKAIARLKRNGLVETRPYRSVFLTAEGRALAETSKRRHGIVLEFLRALGVSETTANCDAEGIEHHVSEETLAAFRRFIEGGDGRCSPACGPDGHRPLGRALKSTGS
jgi:DtxR family manganese transport transcriptional regulator